MLGGRLDWELRPRRTCLTVGRFRAPETESPATASGRPLLGVAWGFVRFLRRMKGVGSDHSSTQHRMEGRQEEHAEGRQGGRNADTWSGSPVRVNQ